MQSAEPAARHLTGAWLALIACAVLPSAACATPAGAPLTLVTEGKSDYRIVIPKRATVHETRAADEFHNLLMQISGADLPIVTDDQPVAEKEIILGRNRHIGLVGTRVNFRPLGKEGFTLRTRGDYLIVAGGYERGTLYGVVTFFEEYLGCRWFTPDVSKIPAMPTITVPPIEETQKPALDYRFLYYAEARDRDFAVHQRHNAGMGNAQPGDVDEELNSGNFLAHTVFSFCPPDQYFASHPEYYSLLDGERRPNQLCLTNPDVLKIVIENLRKAMATNPGCTHWNVSQMDNGDLCQCPNCKALDEREGGPSGSILSFVNQVAAAFPDKTISTPAYWYSMMPPKTIRPAKNVQIIYCTEGDMRGCFGPWWEGYAAMAHNLHMWTYVIPCHNIVAPCPNLFLYQRDMRSYVSHGAKSIFIEGSNEPKSDLAELRVYVLSKLMWDPNCDVDTIVNEFLEGYYGAAAGPIRTYLDTMFESFIAAGDDWNGHDWPQTHAHSCFTPELIARYEALFDQAEQTVAKDPELLLRVQQARLSVMHAEVQLGYGSVDHRIDLVKRMQEIAKASDTPHFRDFGEWPTEEYLPALLARLEKEKAGQ